jgi:hypothetical protein
MPHHNKTVLIARVLLLLCLLLPASFGSAQEVQEATPVEQAEALPRPPAGTLGTMSYKPSEKEKPFFAKLAADEQRTGSMFSDYSITGKKGVYVGWFGIVRSIEENQATKETKLLVEHKYFDGLTDTHIMALSFNGGGDFTAVLSGTGLGIKNLSLVKIYGVVQTETNSIPDLKPEYVRHWDWGRFTFMMDYGSQKGNTKWQKLNKAKDDRIYSPFPDEKYYVDRLGKRSP